VAAHGRREQAANLPIIGFLSGSWPATRASLMTAFRQGVRESGYTEGKSVSIEYRWAEDQYDRLPDLAVDLVRRQVAVIAATDSPSTVAAKAATTTIPTVFMSGGDPVPCEGDRRDCLPKLGKRKRLSVDHRSQREAKGWNIKRRWNHASIPRHHATRCLD
jgi:hypothetical protein